MRLSDDLNNNKSTKESSEKKEVKGPKSLQINKTITNSCFLREH